MDTIWLIVPSEDRVRILRDTMTPEQENTESTYSQLCLKYHRSALFRFILDKAGKSFYDYIV